VRRTCELAVDDAMKIFRIFDVGRFQKQSPSAEFIFPILLFLN
jgi:hypothetical protein